MSVTFVLDGLEFQALNGGPQFVFTEAISLFVSVDTQAEIDRVWGALTEGGVPGQCGGSKTSSICLGSSDPDISNRVMQAMLGMTKLDIDGLRAAADGR